MPVVQYQSAKTATSGKGAVTVTADPADDLTTRTTNLATIATANATELARVEASKAASLGKSPVVSTDR